MAHLQLYDKSLFALKEFDLFEFVAFLSVVFCFKITKLGIKF